MNEYAGQIIRFVDGDTVDVLTVSTETNTYTRFGVTTTITCTQSETVRYRLTTIDAPERGKPGYREAIDYCNKVLPPGTWTQVVTYWADGKFGRILADLLIPGQGSTTISSMLLRDGHAVVWQPRPRRKAS